MITPVAFTNIKNHTYTIFAIINAIMVPSVYFFFPETAYRSLEEMDTIFQKVHGWKGAFQVVHQARIEPPRYGKNGELLIAPDKMKKEGNTKHRTRSTSEDSATPDIGIFGGNGEESQLR